MVAREYARTTARAGLHRPQRAAPTPAGRRSAMCPIGPGTSACASASPGWKSSSVLSSSSGAPAAHACGREAVGNATGTEVSAAG